MALPRPDDDDDESNGFVIPPRRAAARLPEDDGESNGFVIPSRRAVAVVFEEDEESNGFVIPVNSQPNSPGGSLKVPSQLAIDRARAAAAARNATPKTGVKRPNEDVIARARAAAAARQETLRELKRQRADPGLTVDTSDDSARTWSAQSARPPRGPPPGTFQTAGARSQSALPPGGAPPPGAMAPLFATAPHAAPTPRSAPLGTPAGPPSRGPPMPRGAPPRPYGAPQRPAPPRGPPPQFSATPRGAPPRGPPPSFGGRTPRPLRPPSSAPPLTGDGFGPPPRGNLTPQPRGSARMRDDDNALNRTSSMVTMEELAASNNTVAESRKALVADARAALPRISSNNTIAESSKALVSEARAALPRLSRGSAELGDDATKPLRARPPPPRQIAAQPAEPESADAGGDWKCALCSRDNEAAVDKCTCCGRAKAAAQVSAERLWAGPRNLAPTGLTVFRPAPPPRLGPPPLRRPPTDVDDEEQRRRLMYYRRRPPPKRPKRALRAALPPRKSTYATGRPPPRPQGPPPSHAVTRIAHSVESKHFTARFFDSKRGDLPLQLVEKDQRLKTALPDGVVLSELCSLGGVPCAVTVVQREWRAVVHAVDLERGDEYAATSELHARFVRETAPTAELRLALYRELVAACAFKSTLAARGSKLQRTLVVASKQDGPTAPASGGVVCTGERLLVANTLVHISAQTRKRPDVVEIRIEDAATRLHTTLTFPLGAAPGLAATARSRHGVGRADSAWETPWASAAAQRAAGVLYEPRLERARVAMAVELVCCELTSHVAEENLKTVLRVTPSPGLVATIADACRRHRAAVVIEAQLRRLLARKEVRAAKQLRAKTAQAALAAQALKRDAAVRLQALARTRGPKAQRRDLRVKQRLTFTAALRVAYALRKNKWRRKFAATKVQAAARRRLAVGAAKRKEALAADARKAKAKRKAA
ncbi:hypothetical protein M885DRAFT_506652, partial [Pelagophyceae sp. CCMP2097]